MYMIYTHVIISPAAVTIAPATVCEPAVASDTVALCAPDEPGEKLVFNGRILDYEGRPLEKASIVAYHADRQGLYNPPEAKTRVPRLRGVAVTDRRGGFRFATIRP